MTFIVGDIDLVNTFVMMNNTGDKLKFPSLMMQVQGYQNVVVLFKCEIKEASLV